VVCEQKNAVRVNVVSAHAIYGHTAGAGYAEGHAVGVRAVGARAVLVRAVGKPSAGAHAVGICVLWLSVLSGYAVDVRAIMYTSTVYLLCCRFPYCT
jgi:hypothetical protein